MYAKERLFLTADRKTLVPEGDKRAAFLYAGIGDEIPESAAQRFGLNDGKLGERDAAPPPAQHGGVPGNDPATGAKEGLPGQDKEQAPGPNKEKTPDGDKSGGGGVKGAAGDTAPAADDLTLVKFIGSTSAKALSAAGITSFAQLAAIDPAKPPVVEGMGARVNWSAIVASAIELHEAAGDGGTDAGAEQAGA